MRRALVAARRNPQPGLTRSARARSAATVQRLLLAALVVLAILNLILLGALEYALSIFSTLLLHILHTLAR